MRLLILSYHHIDDEKKYRAGIYPISPERFSKQLDEIKKHFQFISENELVGAIEGKKRLAENSCLITFDDSLKCQYEKVVPILKRKMIPAIFFIQSQPYLEGKACLAHKIHYLLSVVPPGEFLDKATSLYEKIKEPAMNLEAMNLQKIRDWYRYDDAETARLKFLLNRYLEPAVTEKIISGIFKQYYKKGEKDFCREFYLSLAQLGEIKKNKLFSLGLHTHTHQDIRKLPRKNIDANIMKNYSFLRQQLEAKNIRGISYPFGEITESDYENKIADVAKRLGLKYGLTAIRKVNINLETPFVLHRLSPEDLPGGKKPLINF